MKAATTKTVRPSKKEQLIAMTHWCLDELEKIEQKELALASK